MFIWAWRVIKPWQQDKERLSDEPKNANDAHFSLFFVMVRVGIVIIRNNSRGSNMVRRVILWLLMSQSTLFAVPSLHSLITYKYNWWLILVKSHNVDIAFFKQCTVFFWRFETFVYTASNFLSPHRPKQTYENDLSFETD